VNASATDTAFDAATRACWQSAQTNVSSAVMAQIHRRRIAASTARSNARAGYRLGWPLAAACAVCILAIGLRGLPERGSTTPLTAFAGLEDEFNSVEVLDAFAAINLTALDEDPEFLLWLASDEARAMLAEAPSLVMH